MADKKRPSSVTVSDEPTVRETLQYCSSQRAPLNVPIVSRERSHLINTLDCTAGWPHDPRIKGPSKALKGMGRA